MVVVNKPDSRARSNTSMPKAELVDIGQLAALLGGCSTRHVRRLADAGRMPRPMKLGALVRWRRADILSWIAAGCPCVATSGGRDHA